MMPKRSFAFAALVVAFLSGCGNTSSTTSNGQTAVTKAANGDVIALVQTCSGSVTQVTVAGSREGLAEDKVNPELGEFVASGGQGGFVTVNLTHPASPWSAKRALTMPKPPTKTLLVQGFDRSHDTETTEVTMTPSQLQQLKPDVVLVASADGTTSVQTTKDAFSKGACTPSH